MKKIIEKPYEEVLEKVKQALKNQGFGIITEIDVKKTFKQKINIDFQKYIILGACNPVFAHKLLQQNLDYGLLLPCNVIVYEENNNTAVAIVKPTDFVNNELAKQVEEKLQAVLSEI